eukprot:5213964-Ditylum_brightwellii.AAC.1
MEDNNYCDSYEEHYDNDARKHNAYHSPVSVRRNNERREATENDNGSEKNAGKEEPVNDDDQ